MRVGRQREVIHLAQSLGLQVLAPQETHTKENTVRQLAGYTLLQSSRLDTSQEGREYHGVGMILSSHLFAHTVKLCQGHSRIMGILLGTLPLPILLLSCYAPTAAQSEEEKTQFFDTLAEVLDENSRAIPILMGGWNAKPAEKEPNTYGIGANIFPMPYSLAEMPAETLEINSVHTRCIVKTSGFTRGVCKNRGFY